MREIRTTLLPNGEQQVQAGGDFVYVDFVDREIKLMIHDQIITVNAGDKVRPQRSFRSLTVINPDDSSPVVVVLKVGEGDYNSQIIRGEVSVTPGVRRADGVFIEDTRRDMTGIIWPVDMGKDVKQGKTLYQTAQNLPETGDEDWFSFDESLQQFLVLSKGDSLGDNATAQYYDLKLNPVSSFPVLYKITNIPNNSPDGQDWGVFNSQPSDIVAYKGGLLICAGGRALMYSPDGAVLSGVALFGATNQGFRSIAVKGDLAYCLFDGGEIRAVNEQGQTVETHSISGGDASGQIDQIRYYGGRFYVWFGGDELAEYDEDFKLITVRDCSGWDAQNRADLETSGFAVAAGLFFSKGATGERAKAVPLDDIYSPVTLAAEREDDCARFTELTWRPEDLPWIDADLVVARVGDRLRLQGQVIKAAIEVLTGRLVEGDYMDSVYAFEFIAGDAWNRKVARNSGSRTFKAASIEDDFTVTLPTRIRITVDDRLELSDPLLTL